MTTRDEPETATGPLGPRAHDIGAGGVVSITVEADDVRVRGVDGTEARVVAPANGIGIETTAEPGRFSIRTARHVGLEKTGFVGIQIGTRGFGMPLRLRVSGTVEVEVPRDARVVVTSSAGDVAVRDVAGGATLKTTSGDISVKRAAGPIMAEAASGDVNVTAVEPIALEVRAVSGDVQARAPRFERVAIETISGDVELGGAFAPRVPHTISTVSGDVEVTLVGGLTLAVRTVRGASSASIRTGARATDGGVRSSSATERHGCPSVRCRRCRGPGRQARLARRPPGSHRRGGRAARRSAGPAAAARASGAAGSGPPGRPGAPARRCRRADAGRSGRTARPDDGAGPGRPADAAPAAASPDPAPAAASPDPPTLAILEALARGEIDVPEAERRLTVVSGSVVGGSSEVRHGG